VPRFLLLALAALGCTAFSPAKDPEPFVPVLQEDFADPFVLLHAGTFYAYATNAQRNQANVQMASSTNLADCRW
jgi:hypothetical protein